MAHRIALITLKYPLLGVPARRVDSEDRPRESRLATLPRNTLGFVLGEDADGLLVGFNIQNMSILHAKVPHNFYRVYSTFAR